MGKVIDITGLAFGRLTVLAKNGIKNKRAMWLCICECGKIDSFCGKYLRNGDTKSCGCLKQERIENLNKIHGESSKKVSVEYWAWSAMKARCYDSNHIGYENYGGRGIIVCDRWLNSFENFLSDMGRRPSDSHSLDRFPNINGNYEPDNCRWATRMEQSRGKRNNRWFEYLGKKMILSDWADFFGVDQATLREHLETKEFVEIYNYYESKK